MQDGMRRLGVQLLCVPAFAPALFPEGVWRLPWKIPCSLMLPLMFRSHQTRREGQGGASLSGKVTLATPAERPPLSCCLCRPAALPDLLGGCCALAPRSAREPLGQRGAGGSAADEEGALLTMAGAALPAPACLPGVVLL